MAGTGTAGYGGDNGPAAEAQLQAPCCVRAGAGSDETYVIADAGNHRIRWVSQEGVITTVAGTGTAGYCGDNGPAARAQLRLPCGVVIGGDGSIHIADTGNHRTRRFFLEP